MRIDLIFCLPIKLLLGVYRIQNFAIRPDLDPCRIVTCRIWPDLDPDPNLTRGKKLPFLLHNWKKLE